MRTFHNGWDLEALLDELRAVRAELARVMGERDRLAARYLAEFDGARPSVDAA